MAEATRQDKTEQPTQKRQRDALERGQVPRSRELAGVVAIAAMAVGLGRLSRGEWGQELVAFVLAPLRERAIWSMPSLADPVLQGASRGLDLLVAPLGIAVVAVATALLLQGRPVFTLKPFEFKPEKLDPMKNLGRALDPKRALGKIAWSHLKLAIVVLAAGWGLSLSFDSLLGAAEVEAAALPSHLATLLTPALRAMLGGALLVAAIDQGHALWSQAADLRMTKQEVKEEHQQAEGDPLIKARMRSLMRETARRRMIHDVRTAAVVIVNPTHYSVALRYVAGRDAVPVVVARGRGHVALRIREEAAAFAVPVVRSPALARSLHAELRVGFPVREAHYGAVAAILVEVLKSKAVARPGSTP